MACCGKTGQSSPKQILNVVPRKSTPSSLDKKLQQQVNQQSQFSTPRPSEQSIAKFFNLRNRVA